jgi:hypothetical protein
VSLWVNNCRRPITSRDIRLTPKPDTPAPL